MNFSQVATVDDRCRIFTFMSSGHLIVAFSDSLRTRGKDSAEKIGTDCKKATHSECARYFRSSLTHTFSSVWNETSNLDASMASVQASIDRLISDDGKLMDRMIKRHNDPVYTPIQPDEPHRTPDTVNFLSRICTGPGWVQLTREQVLLFLTNLKLVLPDIKNDLRAVEYTEAIQANFDQLTLDATESAKSS